MNWLTSCSEHSASAGRSSSERLSVRNSRYLRRILATVAVAALVIACARSLLADARLARLRAIDRQSFPA